MRIPRTSHRHRKSAFTLLETLIMLGVLTIFTLLLAGVTKPWWGEATLNDFAEDESSLSESSDLR
ncbi:MAG: type II secretion system protein [Verrucomicrobiales bacterium]|nr:type II secretion system protein [Verrucomicrobiales bacterium]